MDQHSEARRHTVLFVDDEEKARKYFARACAERANVITAGSVAEAMELLEGDGGEIAVLVTDQRMPGETGVELLRKVRDTRPDIVRMLTTAYTEISDAIDAVNRGEIFRYITKPWDIQQLRTELTQALTFYELRRERDLLLREKLNVWQRMVDANRVRDLVVMAGSFVHLRNALPAVAAFLRQVGTERDAEQSGLSDWRSLDLWSLTQNEIERMLAIASAVLECTASGAGGETFPDTVNVGRIVEEAAERLSTGSPPVDIRYEGEAGVTLKGNGAILGRLVELLAKRIGGREPVRIAVSSESVGIVQLLFVGGAGANRWLGLGSLPGREPGEVHALAEMLAVYLLCFHHAGQLVVEPALPEGVQALVRLPLDPDATAVPSLPPYWLEDILAAFEPSD